MTVCRALSLVSGESDVQLKSVRARVLVGALALPLLAFAINPPAASAAGPPSPGRFTGYGFDACQAPNQSTMDELRRESPFWGVGIYIGGSERSCAQPNLTRTWVQTQRARGWKLFPVWVGPQSHCADAAFDHLVPESNAAAKRQGFREATRAARAATGLGLAKGSSLFLDVESYDNSISSCNQPVLNYVSGWNSRLKALGWKGAMYSSAATGIRSIDNIKTSYPDVYALPSSVWFAEADGKPNARSKYLRSSYYVHQRVKQYAVDVTRTYGSVTLDLDLNFIDIAGGSLAPKKRPSCGVSLDFARYKILRKGSKGPQVKAAQCLLRRTHAYGGKVTGYYTPRTAVAVARFQRSIGVSPTRQVGRGTWAALHSYGSSPLVKRGSSSDRVRGLQRALAAALNRPVAASGIFTAGTTSDVRRYQAAVGIKANGIAGPTTWRALKSAQR